MDILPSYMDILPSYMDILPSYMDILSSYMDILPSYMDILSSYMDILPSYMDINSLSGLKLSNGQLMFLTLQMPLIVRWLSKIMGTVWTKAPNFFWSHFRL